MKVKSFSGPNKQYVIPTSIIYRYAASLSIFPALCAMVVYNIHGTGWLWSHDGFLTRKMSRVTVISIPLTASVCHELLELLGLVRGWFTARTGNCVPFIWAIDVMSNWGQAEKQQTYIWSHRCIPFLAVLKFHRKEKMSQDHRNLLGHLQRWKVCNMHDCMWIWISHVSCLKDRHVDVHTHTTMSPQTSFHTDTFVFWELSLPLG